MIQIPDLYFFSASTEKSCDKDWSQLFYYTYFSTSKEKIEPVFLVSEFSLRYVLIFEDKILVLVVDIRRKILRCTSEMILRPEDKAH